MGNLFSDDYNRIDNASSWGNGWSRVRGTSTFGISSNQGIVTNNSGPYCIAINTGTTADIDEVITITRSNTVDVVGLICRYIDINNWYSCNIGAYTNNIVFSKMVAGVYSDVTFGPNTSYPVTTTYKVRFRVIGSNINIRAWDASGAEPGTWDISTTDTSISSAGYYGVYADPAGAAAISFDNYSVTDGSSVTTQAFTDSNPVTEVYSLSGSATLVDLNSAAMDTYAATGSTSLTDSNVLAEVYTLLNSATYSDLLTVAEAQALTGEASNVDALSIVEILSTQLNINLSDSNNIQESFFITPSGGLTSEMSVEWKTRDSVATWQTRDGITNWKTRDAVVEWSAR